MIDILPNELLAFLQKGGQLAYDSSEAQAGKIVLRTLDEMRIGRVFVAPLDEDDPHFGRSGVYRIPAVSLVKSCELYDPDYLLSYLPFEKSFAVFDGDHARLTLFPDASWSDIVANPMPYLNSLWEEEPEVPCARHGKAWGKRYEFFEDAFE